MRNYTKIPNEMFEKSDLSVQERYVYCLLLKYGGKDDNCWPSQKTMAEVMGVTDRQIRSVIKSLIKKTDIVITRRRGWNRSNTYTFSKEITIDRKNNSYHLRSLIPLPGGTELPPKTTYLKGKGKRSIKSLEKCREDLINKGILRNKPF